MAVIYLRVSPDLKERIDKLAERKQISTADLVRQMIFEWFEVEEAKRKLQETGIAGLFPHLGR